MSDLDAAFADSWGRAGAPLERGELLDAKDIPPAGDVAARVICGQPGMFRTYRFDQFIASMAQRNLWLTDAYFVATTSYVQALGEAARDGVDVRLLVPGSSDVPVLQPIVRAGLPIAHRSRHPRLRVERLDDARQDGGGGWPLGARRFDESQHGELGHQLGTRRGRRGPGPRRGHGGDVSGGSRQRDGDRSRLRHATGPGPQHALPAVGVAHETGRRSPSGGRRAGAEQLGRRRDGLAFADGHRGEQHRHHRNRRAGAGDRPGPRAGPARGAGRARARLAGSRAPDPLLPPQAAGAASSPQAETPAQEAQGEGGPAERWRRLRTAD